jgi:hypothetical protein
MSGVNGAELARLAQSRRTALPIVFVTGYVDTASLGEIGEERMSRSIRERQACEYKRAALRMPAVDNCHRCPRVTPAACSRAKRFVSTESIAPAGERSHGATLISFKS